MRNNEYFRFLRSLVCIDVYDSHEEEMEFQLLQRLFGMEFYSLIPNDDNRGMDGIELREQFIDQGGGQHVLPFGPCTVLEMLIGLSYRLEFETTQSKWEKTPREWFWILIDNLNLDFRSYPDLNIEDYRELIFESVTLFLERGYKSNGEGGLFPLKNPKKDQKKVEIWYQMTNFVVENYPI